MSSLAECRRQFNLINASYNLTGRQHIQFNEEETIIYGKEEKDKIYIPSPTGKLFHDTDSSVNLVLGPYGSGKSTMCLQHIVKSACRMPFWSSGRRRSRWAIIRNTSGELYSTTLKSWLMWFSELGDIQKRQKPILTYEHTFNDGKGIVELEVLFIALDREDDIRKIKSMELTGAYINELSEVPQGALSHLKGRVNHRYPSLSFCDQPYWSGIISDTNSPDGDHWIVNDFENKSLESYRIFKQPPGLIKIDGKWNQNPHCDNYANLSPDYYTKLAEGQSEDFVKVYCLGEYGIVSSGKVVYSEFNSDLHVVDRIDPIPGLPIHLAFDFGLTPACMVVQVAPNGQLRLLREYQGQNMGIRTFARNIVIPSLQEKFPSNKIGISVGDPAGMAGDQIMEELSCIGELNSLGLETRPAKTNDIEARINAVKYFLNMMIDGKPALIISREGCPISIKGFVKEYIYKRLSIKGEERYRDVPDKNMYSHLQDDIQYIALEFAADYILKSKAKKEVIDMYNPVMRFM